MLFSLNIKAFSKVFIIATFENINYFKLLRLKKKNKKIKNKKKKKKEKELLERFQKLNEIRIADDFDYDSIKNLSNEGRQRLKMIRPRTLGSASQILGVSVSDLTILMAYIRQM